MIHQFEIVNFSCQVDLPKNVDMSGVYQLETCQRTLFAYLNTDSNSVSLPDYALDKDATILKGTEAYEYMLEIICGLQSQLIGENEIVCQFKQAYLEYMKGPQKDGQLIRILEKCLKDGKEVRARHLKGIGQKTYAGITRKFLFSRPDFNSVLILGSGSLAKDLVNQFRGKVKIYLSARNEAATREFEREFGCEIVPWGDFDSYTKFPHIANTIGTEKKIFTDENFFLRWLQLTGNARLFVDLGSPSSIQTQSVSEVNLVQLEDIFEQGKSADGQKAGKIRQARDLLQQLVQRRAQHFIQASQKRDISIQIA